MSTVELKSGLHQLIDEVQDEQILAAVYTILDKQRPAEDDFWLRLTPEQQADIEAGVAALKEGRKMSAADVFARYK